MLTDAASNVKNIQLGCVIVLFCGYCVVVCRVVCELLAAGVTCVTPSYLIDWLAQPWDGLAQHYLFGTEKDLCQELQQLEAARQQDQQQQPQQQSMSF